MADQPDQATPARLAEEFLALAEAAASVAEARSRIEELARRSLDRVGAKAVVFSISGSVGRLVAVGGGYEWVYSPRLGWNSYCQLGVGLSAPGKGVALEVGFIWDMEAAREYRGLFVEGALSFSVSEGMGIVSGEIAPGDVRRFFAGRRIAEPRGLKAGGGYGSRGATASLLLEHYWQLTTSQAERAREAEAEATTDAVGAPGPQPEP